MDIPKQFKRIEDTNPILTHLESAGVALDFWLHGKRFQLTTTGVTAPQGIALSGDLDAPDDLLILTLRFQGYDHFAKVQLRQERGFFWLPYSTVLYRLERREIFRLEFGESHLGTIEILSGQNRWAGSLMDLATGGGGLSVADPEQKLSAGMHVTGSLTLDQTGFSFAFSGEIRHLKHKSKTARGGLVFIGLREGDEQALLEQILEIQRRLFVRME